MIVSLLRLHALISFLAIADAALTLTRDTPSLHVPLRHRAAGLSKRRTSSEFAAMADGLRKKYKHRTQPLGRRQGTGAVDITDESADSSYSGQLSIGSPGQNFDVILDTGSSDLWVASTLCTQGCGRGITSYNPSSSSSFTNQNQPVSITYGSGAIEGVLTSDTVTMGGFTVKSQTFAAATAVSSGLLDQNLSGLLGLGFKSIANTGATPIVQSLASGSSFSQPLMAFYLARHINDPNVGNTNTGGSFTLGGTNSSLFTGDIDFVNIPSTVTPGFWLLPVTGITVQGSSVSIPSGSGSNAGSASQLAAIDTGTTLIGGPSDAVAAIYAQIPGSQKATGQLQGYYTYPCSTEVDISFSFGGTKSWPINPADFQLQAQNGGGATVCVGGIFDLEASSAPPGSGGPPQKRQSSPSTNPAWIIGDTFLKNVYSVFRYDPPSVGFAQLNPSLPGAGTAPGAAVNTGGPSSTSSPRSSSPTPSRASSASVMVTTKTSPIANSSSPSVSNQNGATRLKLDAVGLALVFGVVGAALGVIRLL